MSFSLTSAGSPAVPRVAATWVRSTALPAAAAAAEAVAAARTRGASQLTGASGTAYSAHAGQMLLHLVALRSRLARAASLFESYADRLAAHEALLAGVRARALAAGLEVVGDQVVPPDDSDVTGAVTWSELAQAVLDEHRDLAAWVITHLEGAVESFLDESGVRWVWEFLDKHHGTLLTGATTTTLERMAERRLTQARQYLAGLDPGGAELDDATRRAIASGEVRALHEGAEQLDRLSRAAGPIGVTYDTVRALESDEPAEGLFTVAGGVAGGAAVPLVLAAMGVGLPIVTTGIVVTVASVAAAEAAEVVWRRLPEPMQDSADEIVGEVVDGAKDLVSAGFDEVRSWG